MTENIECKHKTLNYTKQLIVLLDYHANGVSFNCETPILLNIRSIRPFKVLENKRVIYKTVFKTILSCGRTHEILTKPNTTYTVKRLVKIWKWWI